MDESAAASLALDAAQTLKGIGEDVAQLKELGLHQLEVLQKWPQEVPTPADDEAQALLSDPDPADWVTEVHSSAEVPAEFFPDLMGFQYMQTALLVFVLVALLLNLGANLWLAFSDKWRS